MKILPKNFIKKFNGKILNIHPSLLPKYKLNIHERVIQNKKNILLYSSLCKLQIDSGKIILQKKLRLVKTILEIN